MKAFLAAVLVVLLGQSALAADSGSIVIASPWLRATPKGAPVAGGYVTITNKGSEPDRLIGASLPIAATGEIHSMSMDHGVMHMARLDNGLEIKPGATVTLAPGGFHVMFQKPTAVLKEGETIDGTLTFAKAGTVPVTFVVRGMAAKAPSAPMHHDMGAMPGMDMH